MVRRSVKLAVILAAVLLFIGLVLMISPKEAYAGDYNYPAPENIYIDYDYSRYLHFTSTDQYFLSTAHEFSDAGWDACYVPEDGILYLKNYKGSSIRINDAAGTQLTICLIGNTSTITANGQFGIWGEGVRLIFTTAYSGETFYDPADEPRLVIKQTQDATGVNGGGIVNFWTGSDPEDIIFRRNADVKVDSFSRRHNSGVRTRGYLMVEDSANLRVSTRSDAYEAYTGQHSEAAYAEKGLILTTYGCVDLSAACRSDWYGENNQVYALYMDDGILNIDPSFTFLAMSAVGRNRAVCSQNIPQRDSDYYGYHDFNYDTYAVSARIFYSDDYWNRGNSIDSCIFPDPSFKDLVSRMIDADGDGWVSSSDSQSVTNIYIDDEHADVASLRGIEYLSSITQVTCEHKHLVEADLANNSELETIMLFDNCIESLSVCGCTELTYLDVDNNLLTSLDVASNTSLRTMYCGNLKTYDSFNDISVVDVSCCPELEYLYCRGMSIKALKLGNNDNLKELFCYDYGDSYLEILDLRGVTKINKAFTEYNNYDVESDYVRYHNNEYDSYLGVDQNTRILTSDSDDISFYPVITNCKLNLAGKIGIRIYFRVPDNARTARILFEGNGYDDSNIIAIDLSKTNNPNYNAAQDLFVIDYPRITSREMTMRIKFFIVDDNGYPLNIYYEQEDMFYGGVFIYCAADWANRIIRTAPSTEAVYMAEALLNYGDCAQRYLNNYNLVRPANPRRYLEFISQTVKPEAAYDMVVSGDPEGAGFDYTRLSLEADTAVRLYFNKAVTVTVDGASKKVYNSGSTWLSIIEGISSRNISRMYNIVATSGGKTVTISYSVLSWANDILNNRSSKSGAAVLTAQALYLYNEAAKLYIK